MKDYTDIGRDSRLRKTDSLAGRPRENRTAMHWDTQDEKSPWAPRTQVSRGTLESRSGGIFTLYDTTGGTAILTYDPDAGIVTIAGSVIISQTINVGTTN